VTGVQAPTWPGTSQASQAPPQARSQQTPSTQVPDAHCPSPPQASPARCFATQMPAEHHWGGEPGQSASVVQAPAQVVPPHAYGAQVCCCGFGQLPAPSQEAAIVATPPAHEPARQVTALEG
jgi:hypothetical protein